MTESPIIWAVPGYLELRWHSWGDSGNDEFVVFNSLSGETHCLNLTAAWVLQYLQEHPASADVLAAEIAGERPTSRAAGTSGEIASLLKEFDQVGLIIPVRP